MASGLNRATTGSPTPSGKDTPLRLELTAASTSVMSTPNSNTPITSALFSADTD